MFALIQSKVERAAQPADVDSVAGELSAEPPVLLRALRLALSLRVKLLGQLVLGRYLGDGIQSRPEAFVYARFSDVFLIPKIDDLADMQLASLEPLPDCKDLLDTNRHARDGP